MKYSFFGPQGLAVWFVLARVEGPSGQTWRIISAWFLTLPVRRAFRANAKIVAGALESQRDHVVIEGTTYEIARRKMKEVG